MDEAAKEKRVGVQSANLISEGVQQLGLSIKPAIGQAVLDRRLRAFGCSTRLRRLE